MFKVYKTQGHNALLIWIKGKHASTKVFNIWLFHLTQTLEIGWNIHGAESKWLLKSWLIMMQLFLQSGVVKQITGLNL